MKWIPERTARNLLKMLGYYAAVLYAVLLLCRAISRGGFTARSLVGLMSLAAVSAMVAGIGFWLNKRLFFAFFSAGLLSGALYMLYIIIFNAAPGWSDAASLFGYVVIALIGLGAGMSAEFVKYLLKPKPAQD